MAKKDKEPAKEEKEEAKAAEGEAGAEGAEGAEGAAAKPGGKKKLIIIIAAAVVVLLIGGGAAAYFTGMLDSLLGKKEEAAGGHGEEGTGAEGEHGAEGEGHGEEAAAEEEGGGGHGEAGGGGPSAKFLEIPKMVVNLNTEDSTPRYLSLSVQLELKSVADRPAMEAVMPRVIDQFQTYLRELRAQDLRGSAGIYRLQTELLWRVNQAAAPIEVKDVLFQEILIQ